MSVREIETAITQLSANDVSKLADWFAEYQAQSWDKQIADDLNAGRLDELLKEVENEYAAGLSRPL